MKKNTKRVLLSVLAVILMLCSLPASAASISDIATRGYVTANTMPVYKYPSPLSKLLGSMSYGEDVRVLDWQDGWFRVQNAKGQIGYCEYGALSRRNPNTLSMYGYAREAGAYVYSKPGTSYRMIACVDMGARLNIVAITKDKEWVRVQNGNRFGYVQTELLSKTPTLFDLTLD